MATAAPVRMAVLGLGQMGTVHASVVHRHPLARLVAVADVDEHRAQAVADATGATPFTDYRDLLAHEDVQAVSICLPDELHLAPVQAAAGSGCHVLLEKPIATNVGEAKKIVAACGEHGVLLMVAHLLRFDPRYLAVREAIAAGTVGEVTHIMAHRNSPWTEGPARYAPGTSLTMHVGVHDIDLVNWFLDDRPVGVFAAAVSRKLADRRMHDLVSAIVRYERGAVANLQYSWALPPTSVTKLDARLEVIGTDGMAIVGAYHGQAVFIADHHEHLAPDMHHGPRLAGEVGGDVREEIGAFLAAILSGSPSPVAPADAVSAVRVAEAIERSVATGREVTIDP